MIRLYTLGIDIADKDPQAVAGAIEQRLQLVMNRHKALLGCTITKAVAGTVEVTLRVNGVHQWDASARARSIATAILLRLGIPIKQGTLQAQAAPPDGRTLKKKPRP